MATILIFSDVTSVYCVLRILQFERDLSFCRSLQLWDFEITLRRCDERAQHGFFPFVSHICDVKENKNIREQVDMTNCGKEG